MVGVGRSPVVGGRAWPKLVVLGLLSSFVVVSVPGEVGAKAPPKKGPVTARYTLTVHFTGYARWEYKYRVDQPSPNVTEENTAWAGTSMPFVLVNRGSPSKPKLAIRVAGNEGYPLRIAGLLEHVGRATWFSSVSRPPDYQVQECAVRVGESTGNASARAVVTLVSNRLRIAMAAEGNTTFEQGTDSCGYTHEAGYCWVTYRSLGSSCLAIPETLGLSSAWWGATSIDVGKGRFGRVFTLTIRRSSLVEPPPPVTDYLFRWVLKFTPVKS